MGGKLVHKIFIVNVAFMHLSAMRQFLPFQRSWTGILCLCVYLCVCVCVCVCCVCCVCGYGGGGLWIKLQYGREGEGSVSPSGG